VESAGALLVAVVVNIARKETRELVEAVGVGAELLFVAEVPLAEHAGGVARVLEHARQRRLASRQAGLLLAGEDGPLQADALLPAAGHQGRPRGSADRAV